MPGYLLIDTGSRQGRGQHVTNDARGASIGPSYASLPGRHYCPVMLPYFSFARGRTEFARLRRRIYSLRLVRRPRLRRRIPMYFVSWPVTALLKARRASRVWGPAAQALGAPAPWRQMPRIWWLAVRYNLTYKAYYGFRLWRAEAFASVDEFLEDHEGIWICDGILDGQDRMLIDDKLRFAELCREHGLPTVPLVAAISPDGKVQWRAKQHRLPPCDLFVKNRALWSGIGASVWVWDAEDESYSCGGLRLGQEALLDHLCEQAVSGSLDWPARDEPARGGLIVQKRVSNHPSVAGMSPHALSTLRCYTWRCGDDPVAVYRAQWRLPRVGMITDHGSRGGLSVPVADDGTLGRARSRLLAQLEDHHPDFKVKISGCRLPGYQAMLDLCRRAHQACGLQGILAWDVALLESGPVLIEGGTSGSVEAPQAAYDQGLGATDFVDIANRLLPESRPAAEPSN